MAKPKKKKSAISAGKNKSGFRFRPDGTPVVQNRFTQGMTRGTFLKTAGVAAAGAGAAAMGLGASAGVAHAHPGTTGDWNHDFEPDSDGFVHTHRLTDWTGNAWSSVEYFEMSCGSRVVSPVSYHPIGPLYLYALKTPPPGEDVLLIPQFQWQWKAADGSIINVTPPDISPPTGYDTPLPIFNYGPGIDPSTNQPWDTDPLTGFTEDKIALFHDTYKNNLITWPLSPDVLPSWYGLDFFIYTMTTGFYNYRRDPDFYPGGEPISDITQAPRPASKLDGNGGFVQTWDPEWDNYPDYLYEGEELVDFDDKTLTVEITVPASPVQEHMKRLVVDANVDVVLPTFMDIFTNALPIWNYAKYVICGGDEECAEEWIKTNFAIPYAKDYLHSISEDHGFNPRLLELVGYTYPIPNGPPVPVYDYEPIKTSYKLRGWFIQGDEGAPLVILTGAYAGILQNWPHYYYRWRKLFYYLAAAGHSVLVLGREGDDISEGWNLGHDFSDAGDEKQLYGLDDIPAPDPTDPTKLYKVDDPIPTGHSVNVFHAIHQLTGGSFTIGEQQYKMKTLDHEGNEAEGQELIAQDTPIVLHGVSHGSWISMRAMHMYVEDGKYGDLGLGEYLNYSDGEPFTGTLKENFDLRGVMDEAGISGCLKWQADYVYLPIYAWMFAEGRMRKKFHFKLGHESEIFQSIDKFPGWMGIHGIHDQAFPVDGCVYAYNRVRGVKDLVTLISQHTSNFKGPNFYYSLMRVLRFIRKATNSPNPKPLKDPANNPQTTLEKAICKVPSIDAEDLNLHPEDMQTGRMFGAKTSLDNQIKKKVEKYLEENPIELPPE